MRSGFWSRFSIILQIFFAIVTEFFAGLVPFVYYLLQKSYQPATWGFLTSFFALVVIHLHILFLKNDLDDWYEPEAFNPIKYLSLTVSLAALVTIGINFYLGYQNQEQLDIDNHYTVCLIASVCLLWCLIIIACTRKYKRYVQMCRPILPTNRY